METRLCVTIKISSQWTTCNPHWPERTEEIIRRALLWRGTVVESVVRREYDVVKQDGRVPEN